MFLKFWFWYKRKASFDKHRSLSKAEDFGLNGVRCLPLFLGTVVLSRCAATRFRKFEVLGSGNRDWSLTLVVVVGGACRGASPSTGQGSVVGVLSFAACDSERWAYEFPTESSRVPFWLRRPPFATSLIRSASSHPAGPASHPPACVEPQTSSYLLLISHLLATVTAGSEVNSVAFFRLPVLSYRSRRTFSLFLRTAILLITNKPS